MGGATPTHEGVRDAVAVVVPVALDQAQVAKVGAELTLVGFFGRLIGLVHVHCHFVGIIFQLILLLF